MRIGPARDSFEQEAEPATERVPSGEHKHVGWSLSRVGFGAAGNPVERPTPGGSLDNKSGNNEQAVSDRAAGPGSHGTVQPIVREVLGSPGMPLDAGARTYFEKHFRNDFGRVRIHSGDDASEAAHSLHASAFTFGNDIVFARGRYAPSTPKGRLLLLHELRHVQQQQDAAKPATAMMDLPTSSHELQARALFDTSIQPVSQQRIQCAPEGEQFAIDGDVANSVGKAAFGDTSWAFLKAVIEGFVNGLKSDLQAGRGEEAKSHLRGLFIPWNAAKFYGGYLVGLVLGLVSPITDLVKGIVGIVKLAGAALEWLAKWSPAGVAISPERQQKIALLTQRFIDVAIQFGNSVAEFAKNPKDSAKKFVDFLESMMSLALGQARSMGAQAAHSIFDFLKEGYYDMGESVGKVIGGLIAQVLLLVFSEAIGNLISEAASMIGKAAEFVAGKAVEFIEWVSAFASKVIGKVREAINGALKLFKGLANSMIDAFEAFKALFTESKALDSAAAKAGQTAGKDAEIIDLAAEREKRALAARAKAKPVIQQRKIAVGEGHQPTTAKFGDEEIHEHIAEETTHKGPGDQLNRDDIGKDNVRKQATIRAKETDLWEGDSKLLGQRLGPKPGPGYQAHHMVPADEPRAAALRDFLKGRGWKDINDADNGVWLPTGSQTENLGAEFKHEFTFDAGHYNDEYFQRMEDILMKDPKISPSGIRLKLRGIRMYLKDGRLPPVGL
jgi:hypothetical protein